MIGKILYRINTMLFEDTSVPASDEELYDRVIGDSVDPVPNSAIASPSSAPSAPSHFADEWTSLQHDIDGNDQSDSSGSQLGFDSHLSPPLNEEDYDIVTNAVSEQEETNSVTVGSSNDVPWSYDEISELYPEVELADNEQ